MNIGTRDYLVALFNRPSLLYIPPSLRSSTINEQTVAKSPNYQSPTVSHSSHRRSPRNISAGIENINETTGPERIPSRQAVVEDNNNAATKRDQRRNDKVMQENHGRKNQELVQIESNEVAASSDKENAKPDPIVFANRRIMKRYNAFFSEKVLQERRSNEGNCITCYKPLKDEDRYHFLFVQKGFFHNLHKDCYEQWKESKCVERIKQER
ncbi:9145_t:CDS:2 [Funneliformis caledonium]|uniref:9145_t:CDS:1 n=1 Tax=Funneliformis caledonium TaxID=1117310 RepID=A0A9N9FVP2_9GLOM|nr:9145_t:CDS:2 [Funneliformis caledonium]